MLAVTCSEISVTSSRCKTSLRFTLMIITRGRHGSSQAHQLPFANGFPLGPNLELFAAIGSSDNVDETSSSTPASNRSHKIATGITAYLKNGGALETAQQIAVHESPRTTKLYARMDDEVTLDENEKS